MSEFMEIFVDGLSQIHFIGGLTRLDFMTLYPENDGVSLSKKANLRVIMNAQQAFLLRESLNTLIQRLQEDNVLQKPMVENGSLKNLLLQSFQRNNGGTLFA